MLQCLKRWPEGKQHVISMERTSARWEPVEEEKGGGGSKHFQKSYCEGQREMSSQMEVDVKSKEDLFIYFYDKATRACLLADDCEVNPPTLVSNSKIQRLGCIFLLPPHPAGLIIFLSRNYTNKLPYKTERDSVQFSSFTQSCPTLCDPMNRSMPGLPVHHQLLEFTQTHFH